MSDDPRLGTGHLDMSSHDQTPDMSMDNAMSVRDAATRANVTEKTIRRWIKSGRLHALKMGGQYRITVADLELASVASPEGDVHDDRPVSSRWVDTGRDSPRVDMSEGPDSGHGQGRPADTVDLAPLVDHIAGLERQVQQLTEAATGWQIRARQAEDRLEALTAGEIVPETLPEPPGSPRTNDTGPRGLWDRLRAWWGT
jgi:excisionase family DNA binding protein